MDIMYHHELLFLVVDTVCKICS